MAFEVRIIVWFFIGMMPFASVFGQRLFPVKINKKWGLINSEGRLVTKPVYDAIGEFKNFGFATMQRDGKVGLLNQDAIEVIPPIYSDIRVLDYSLVSVLGSDDWKVIDLEGNVILKPGYDKVETWKGDVLGFQKDEKWGMVTYGGKLLTEAVFDAIETEDGWFYKTIASEKVGLIDGKGFKILAPNYDEIRIFSRKMIAIRSGKLWGAVNEKGETVVEMRFEAFQVISDEFIKWYEKEKSKAYLYSIYEERLITSRAFENYYPFSYTMILVKENRQLGLMNECGEWVLPPEYNEIQRYGRNFFRVNKKGKWGIIKADNEVIIPFDFDYIAPLRGKFCTVRKGSAFGVCNYHGEPVVPCDFTKIQFEENQIKAYQGESLSIFDFDDDARLIDNSSFQEHFTITIGKKDNDDGLSYFSSYETEFVMENFEWFYSPEKDKWGLRKLEDGFIQIEPVFDYVNVVENLGYTLVGIDKTNKYVFDKTTYRFETVFGLVKNDSGTLITDIAYWHIRLEDFIKGYPLARCIQEGGKHGLMLRSGTMLLKDFAFIGDFNNGYARVSIKGKISGKISPDKYGLGSLDEFLSELFTPNRMVDFTAHDQRFNREAELFCEECLWGYIDTFGRMAVMPQFSYATDFLNEVGIVEKNGKWGAVNGEGKQLIPFEFDDIHFMENTNNKIIRIYKKEEKYGLIDTLGQIRVSAVFDEIGSFSEGKLAVKRNNYWGFVNRNGQEIVPCRFQKVENFSEGLAAVKVGNNWGYVDHLGDYIVKPQYRRAGNFNQGLAWVFTQNGCGFIDKSGKTVVTEQFQRAYDFKFGVARVVVDGKYGLIDQDGNYLLRPKYSDISEFNNFGLAVARYGSDNIRYGVINLKGELITTYDFREIREFKDGMAAVRYRDSYGFINLQGQMVIDAKFSKVSDFSEDIAAVQVEGNCGYIDKEGNWVMEPQFSKCLDFKDGKAVVYRGMKNAGLIDKQGNLLIQPQINRLLDFSDGRGLVRDSSYRFYYITEQAKLYDGYYQKAGEFRYGVAVVQMDGKWGIINQKGIEITPPKYDKIGQFENGYAKVRIKGFSGLTNTLGETIVRPDYEYINYAGEGLFRVEQGDKVGYFDADGNWVWNLSE